MHVCGRQALDPFRTPPRSNKSAKKAKQEAAAARPAGASASAAAISKQQKGRERATGDAPPAKKPRGPVSAAKHEEFAPWQQMAGMHEKAKA